jgi:hypothetical protein
LLARRMLAAATTVIAGAIFLAGPVHAADARHSTTSKAVGDKFDEDKFRKDKFRKDKFKDLFGFDLFDFLILDGDLFPFDKKDKRDKKDKDDKEEMRRGW